MLISRNFCDKTVAGKFRNVHSVGTKHNFLPIQILREIKMNLNSTYNFFAGGSQHDAQEFLLWLLDRVHEDLNVAPRRRPRHAKSSNANANANVSPTDEMLAAEALANYMRFNSSFVMDVFQAQFRSSLTCPTCEKQSNTFDPFLCVSLPIPQKQLMPVYVTVLYIDQTPRQGE